jgi:alanine dehydrogenase
VQRDGGKAIGLTNEMYEKAGATIVDAAEDIFGRADLIIKVKEPQPNECKMLRPGQLLYTYLHLAPDPDQTAALVKSGCTAIAYETVTDRKGGLPLLAPMSEVAGRMSIQAGAHALEKAQGGSGVLLGGVPGVKPAEVLVIGGGVVGINAARMAMGLNARVTILDRSLDRLKYLDELYGDKITTLYSTIDAIEDLLPQTDLVIGAVLIPGAAAPKLVSRKHLSLMRPGSVLVDVAIDQGGCFETSKATTHQHPTYEVDGIIHYCVANMPGGVARTSTFALTNATLPFAVQLANKGTKAMLDDGHLLNGLNVHAGKITFEAVAKDLGYDYVPAAEALKS